MTTVYTKSELESLLEKARDFSKSKGFNDGKFIYRNLMEDIFDKIKEEQDNVMSIRLKDNGGSPQNPINGKLYGLFFQANVNNYTKKPPNESPFGDTRLSIPVEYLVNENSNLYFSDFYCFLSGNHIVTLVLTEDGSPADKEWAEKLIKLDPSSNPFLSFDLKGGMFRVSGSCWVELFYTKDIDLDDAISKGATLEGGIEPIGRGYPYGGLPKTGCSLCDI